MSRISLLTAACLVTLGCAEEPVCDTGYQLEADGFCYPASYGGSAVDDSAAGGTTDGTDGGTGGGSDGGTDGGGSDGGTDGGTDGGGSDGGGTDGGGTDGGGTDGGADRDCVIVGLLRDEGALLLDGDTVTVGVWALEHFGDDREPQAEELVDPLADGDFTWSTDAGVVYSLLFTPESEGTETYLAVAWSGGGELSALGWSEAFDLAPGEDRDLLDISLAVPE